MTRRHRVRTAAAVGAMGLLVSSCGLSLQSLPKLGGITGPSYKVKATFANVVNLPDDAAVRVGAFSVGDVSSIGLSNFQAVVTMVIKKSVKLPVGTTASINFDTPLGEDFIALQPPTGRAATTGPFLLDGASIPESSTTTAPSVEDAFGALGALLNGGGIGQLQTIIDQTNLALNGNQPKIRQLLNSLSTTVTSFAQNTPSIDNALAAIGSLSKVLNGDGPTVTNSIAILGPAIAVLANENGDLNSLVAQLSRLGSVANQIVTASASGTVEDVKALDPLLNQLVGVDQQLGPDLGAIDSLERDTPRITPGDYLQVSINANAEIPPVPSDAMALHKVTLDPPDPAYSYQADESNPIATILEGGLP